ncbi:MAG: protein-glutamate O-methyltransferase CheR [Sulfuricurvum sp.]|uniref:CheR family methyltransferase n=1 Tax=Sulfuricurvum sp. TaxID=2025608 RepID=UPI0025F964D3|nr:protein-glutamate O-methyltransferase CheR [Sulfuricurvum sp.]MBV5322012.1 protein-glutamate O-methyltransferase CheR [Sulfuricurvum sp.]
MYSAHQLERARALTYKHSGITLGSNKDVMIANRLDKLKRDVGHDDIDAILNAVERGNHVETFVSSFTTNKTNFFREEFHFDDLKNRVFQEAIAKGGEFKIYCSAASTGEEPYSILMTMEQAKEEYGSPMLNYSLLATDIDLDVLKHATNGVYEWNKNADDFPDWIKPATFFKRRPHPSREGDYLIKAKETLARRVRFNQHNLMAENYPFKPEEFDVVFCRNVLIYFSQADQNVILKKLFRTLKLGGTLYLGHSESPLELTPYVERYGQNIFVKVKEF